MFLHCFMDIPLAAHSCWEGYKITFPKSGCGSSISWGDRHRTSKEIAGLILAIRPRKLSLVTAPSAPVADSFLVQKVLAWLRDDFDVWFLTHEDAGRDSWCNGGTGLECLNDNSPKEKKEQGGSHGSPALCLGLRRRRIFGM